MSWDDLNEKEKAEVKADLVAWVLIPLIGFGLLTLLHVFGFLDILSP